MYCQWQYVSRRKSHGVEKKFLTLYAIGSTFLGMKKDQPSRQYDKPFQVRVTPEQHAQFSEAAKSSGVTLSAWARQRLIQAARKDLKQAGGD